jgi:hypothetical protein
VVGSHASNAIFVGVSRTRTVVFGRINRRRDEQTKLGERTFAEDLRALAESRLTRATIKLSNGQDREWIAADLTIDPHNAYLTGVLGYTVVDRKTVFDEDSWSWVKGESAPAKGALPSTMVPFAIDLNSKGRWVAFVTSQSIRYQTFQQGFGAVLNVAVRALALWPSDWEFDLVTSRGTVRAWVRANPRVVKMVRKLQFSNPGLDLDDARRHMRALNATTMREEYQAVRNGALSTNSQDFEDKLEGVETGDASIELWARPEGGGPTTRFKSATKSDSVLINEFGSDLHLGMELVQRALDHYVTNKAKHDGA